MNLQVSLVAVVHPFPVSLLPSTRLILHINPSVIDSEDDIKDAHRDKHITWSKFHDAASITDELRCTKRKVGFGAHMSKRLGSRKLTKSQVTQTVCFQVMRVRMKGLGILCKDSL